MPAYKFVFDTIEVASLWENAIKLYYSVLEATGKVKGNLLITAHVSHFYPNGIGIYFTFGGVPPKGTSDLEFYQNCWNSTIKAVLNAGGSIGHHHGVGMNRSRWMAEEWGKSMKTMKEIKKLLDPNNILNPGKIYVDAWKRGEK